MGESDLDRKLAEAAGRSPELAAMLAGKHDDPSARYKRLFVVVIGLAAVVGGVWLAVSTLGGGGGKPKAQEPAQEIDTSRYLAPIKTEAGAAGEEVADFQGFAVSVDTEPPGAVVSIRGVVRGEAPVFASVDCRPGEKVEIRAQRAGLAPVRRETVCRKDTLVKLTLRLGAK